MTKDLAALKLFRFGVAFLILIMVNISALKAQTMLLPYSFDLSQKVSPLIYSPNNNYHTAFKPFLMQDSTLQAKFDSVLNYGTDSSKKSWVLRKLFQEHLVEAGSGNVRVYADYLPDVQIGRDFRSKATTWVNTRGIQVGLSVGSKFQFYTSFFENQAQFVPYVRDFINTYKVVPGQSIKDFYPVNKTVDYSYSTAIMSYSPVKQLNMTIGYDKNFIGDGYRSLFLSDVSSNYSSFKVTGELGKFQYTTMWAYIIDPLAPKADSSRGVASEYKWGVFQYLDWNISNRLTIGLFQSVLWAAQNSDGSYRGFDFRYGSPVIFLRPIESSDPVSPDKTHIGLSGKYKFLNNLTFYGQFLLDDFKAKEFFSGSGYWGNKWAAQFGVKAFNAFGVRNLNGLLEFNTARPYTYSHFQEITSYSNQAQPLAHPYGANFKELVSVWNYSFRRFDFRLQGVFAKYGLDMNGLDYGKDIFRPYTEHFQEYNNEVGQGLNTRLLYGEARIGFIINPRYGLRVEAGGVFRKESNEQFDKRTAMLTIGLRSTFRNLYYDF